MTLRKLDKSEWHVYCDEFSKSLVGSRLEHAAAFLTVNHDVVAQSVPLLGIAYESKKDLFDVMLQDLEHRVLHPQTLYVDEGPRGIAALEIIDAGGLRHGLSLSHPIKFMQIAKKQSG
jgi:Family of unknown function (DUF5335)